MDNLLNMIDLVIISFSKPYMPIVRACMCVVMWLRSVTVERTIAGDSWGRQSRHRPSTEYPINTGTTLHPRVPRRPRGVASSGPTPMQIQWSVLNMAKCSLSDLFGSFTAESVDACVCLMQLNATACVDI